MASSVSSGGGGGRHAAARAHHHQHRRRQQQIQQQQLAAAHSEHELDTAIARIGARSQSLTALQPSIMQPRMARLETLEAKMASIEVSLSSTALGRRRKSGASPSPRTVTVTVANKENHAHPTPQPTPIGRQATPTSQIVTPTGRPKIGNSGDRARRLKAEIDSKKMVIKNIKLALDRLDITDNIDVRIRQAELEYNLGREELNLLTIQEELRHLEEEERERGRVSEGGATDPGGGITDRSLYSWLARSGGRGEVVGVKMQWDAGGLRFGASQGNGPGLLVDWSAEGSALHRGDRILEVNSRPCGQWSLQDLSRALATRPSPAHIVLLRQLRPVDTPNGDRVGGATLEVAALREELNVVRAGAEEARKIKDGLKKDNLRLTHRISYLEEQVQELLDRHAHSPHPPSRVTSVVDIGSGEVKQVYGGTHDSTPVSRSSRSVRSLDLEADYASEPAPPIAGRRRPLPPKKPLRLSLHRRAQSLQSVEHSPAPSPAPPPQNTEPPAPAHRKRTHRGEYPQGALRWTTRTQGNKWC